MGVLQRVQAGSLGLDTDINSYLTLFQYSNPANPSAPVTVRHLLAHASGLAGDDYGVLQQNIRTNDADVQPLGEMLRDLLSPTGSRYNGGANYTANAPGSAFTYSSIGISLAAYVAQAASGTTFDVMTGTSIFGALGMSNTSWRLNPYANRQSDLAVMYNWNGTTYEVVAPFTFADYPAGSIRTNVPEIARFLAAIMRDDGTFGGAQILSPAMLAELRAVAFPAAHPLYALGWQYSQLGSREMLGWGGDDAGASTEMRYDVGTRKGVVLFMNVTRRPDTNQILERLVDETDGCN